MKVKREISQDELDSVIDRILIEAENQAKYKNEKFVGLTYDQVCEALYERIGNDWEVK